MITPSFSLTATERVLPRLALDFTTANLDARVTFTRSGATATRVNSSGYIETMAADTPRFDYNPVSLLCNGLLIEESRTNLLTYSDDFRDTTEAGATRPWVHGSFSSTTADVVISPDGTQNADKIVGTTTANNQNHMIYQAYTTSAVAYVFSVFAKAAEKNWILLSDSLSGAQCYFDTSAGTVGTATSCTGSISDFGNGWYRCSIAFTGVAGASLERIFIARSGSATTWIGNDTDGVYLYGAQLEAGAFATSYIPTTTAALTRNADVATMTGTNFSDWYNDTAGTFVVDATTFATSFAATRYFMDASSKMSIGCNPAYRGGAPVTITLSGTNATNVASKIGLSGDAAGYALGYNGNAPTTNATALVSGATALNIGALNTLNNNSFIDGHIRKLSYWPQKLTNAELQAFTK